MKLKEFQRELRKKRINCCILANLKNKDENIFYLLQKNIDYCFLLIPAKGKALLFIPPSEKWKSGARGVTIRNGFTKMDFLKKYLKGSKKTGINKSVLSLNAYKQLRKTKKTSYVDVSTLLYALRETKTSKEIKNITEACKITDRIISQCIKNFRKFRTERDVKDFLKSYGYELSFPPIVASGKNSAMPHYEDNLPLKKGFCVIDFGIKCKGYCSDITRTVYLGKPSKKETELYNLLLDTQREILNKIKANKTREGMHKLIKESLGKYHKQMIHDFGHSLGIDVHDPYKYDIKKRFAINTVHTVEPGIYFKNKFGIRIEDDVVITKSGCKVLTKTSKKLVTI